MNSNQPNYNNEEIAKAVFRWKLAGTAIAHDELSEKPKI